MALIRAAALTNRVESECEGMSSVASKKESLIILKHH